MAATPTADPFTAAFSSFAGGFGKSLGDGLTGGGGPFIGGSSAANSFGTTMDGSGWIVNVAGKQDATASLSRTSSVTPNLYDSTPQLTGAGGGGGVMQAGSGVLGLVLAGVFAVMILRAGKRK